MHCGHPHDLRGKDLRRCHQRNEEHNADNKLARHTVN
ncbi:hypothetical protein PSYPI_35960 [Pseudomonas syringae pv. pisi str. 1704B]|uniref:Uncharacterized protein n=1 Tax=Pseudomonas syringae pv. pisi str. 1704B TaxID=629263 RepID=F3GJX0_PSESJ|nr:hypothetical protein PSYPI_35960 [Pseudomonas syringae pv. pisi str. 1704B]